MKAWWWLVSLVVFDRFRFHQKGEKVREDGGRRKGE